MEWMERPIVNGQEWLVHGRECKVKDKRDWKSKGERITNIRVESGADIDLISVLGVHDDDDGCDAG